jgi:hypothetical protein
MLRFSRLLAGVVAITGLAGVLAVLLLGRRLIAPLSAWETRGGNLRWGWVCPRKTTPRSIYELQRLNSAHQLALTAIEGWNSLVAIVSGLVRVMKGTGAVAREIHDGPLQGVTALISR